MSAHPGSRWGPAFASRRCAAAVLVYHSVADVEHDPFGITVSPADFDGQMAVLAQRFNPLPLSELCAGLDRGELPPRAVVVTFDDGYANNLEAALPSLAAHGVPATLFVATGYIGERREYWWDELERLVAVGVAGHAAPWLELVAGERRLGCAMDASGPAVQGIAEWLKAQPVDSVEDVLGQLRGWAGVDGVPAPRATHRPLTLDELREIAASPQIEIGAHTSRHPRLGSQNPGVQRDEIERSRSDLAAWLGAAPASFAYPFGNPDGDYSAASVALVRAAGFACAVSGAPGLTGPGSPRYELPRWFVTTPAPREFERWLDNRFRVLPLRAVGKLANAVRRTG